MLPQWLLMCLVMLAEAWSARREAASCTLIPRHRKSARLLAAVLPLAVFAWRHAHLPPEDLLHHV